MFKSVFMAMHTERRMKQFNVQHQKLNYDNTGNMSSRCIYIDVQIV